MKKSSTLIAALTLCACLGATPAWSAGDKVRGENASGPAGEMGQGLVNTNRGAGIGSTNQATGILLEEEISHILYMRQEEKLARDVYLTLYDHYLAQNSVMAQIFLNISHSEQRHMDALKTLIDKYGLEDSAADDTVGAFSDTDADFTALYDSLVSQGKNSYCDAMQTGILIEALDIEDIEFALPTVEATDVTRVLNNLLNGSYNHLGAFTTRFETNCQ